jgi:hypothetical protein
MVQYSIQHVCLSVCLSLHRRQCLLKSNLHFGVYKRGAQTFRCVCVCVCVCVCGRVHVKLSQRASVCLSVSQDWMNVGNNNRDGRTKRKATPLKTTAADQVFVQRTNIFRPLTQKCAKCSPLAEWEPSISVVQLAIWFKED